MKKAVILLFSLLVLLSACEKSTISEESIDSSSLGQETSNVIDANAVVSDIYSKILVFKDIFENRLPYIEAPEPIDEEYDYVIVNDERFKSFDDIYNFFKTFFPEYNALNFVNQLKYPFDEGNPSYYVERNRVLYKLREPGLILINFRYWVYDQAEITLRDDGSIFVKVPTKERPEYPFTLDYYFIIVNNGENWIIKEYNVYRGSAYDSRA